MLIKPSHLSLQLRSSALSLLILPVAILANPFSSTLGSNRPAIADTIIFRGNFDPPGDDAPTHTRGAGSRSAGRCSADSAATRSLMPVRNYGLTLAERPAIFLQLPEARSGQASGTTAQQAVLTFQDGQGKLHSRSFLPIAAQTNNPAMVSFQLPADAPALTVGKNYRWTLTLVCGDRIQPDDPVFTGWVQRVERTAQIDHRLQAQTPLQQAQWYGDRGYWYDLLATLVQAGYTDSEMWRSLITTTHQSGGDR
jgi:hypothetical protein